MATSILSCNRYKSICPLPDIQNIRMIRELNLAALDQQKDKQLLLWYILRAISNTAYQGYGIIDYKTARHICLNQFGYTSPTFDRHFWLGKGKLFHDFKDRDKNGKIISHRIKIYGPQKAFEYLDTYTAKRWVDIEACKVAELPRKALLYNVGAYRPFGTGRYNAPVSRQSLKEITKVNIRTQRRYDNQVDTDKVETKVKNYDTATHKRFAQKILVTAAKGKKIRITRQLGNIYISHATQSSKGMVRKISKEARQRAGVLITGEATNAGVLLTRRFYSCYIDAVRGYLRGKSTGQDMYYPTRNNEAVLVQCAV